MPTDLDLHLPQQHMVSSHSSTIISLPTQCNHVSHKSPAHIFTKSSHLPPHLLQESKAYKLTVLRSAILNFQLPCFKTAHSQHPRHFDDNLKRSQQGCLCNTRPESWIVNCNSPVCQPTTSAWISDGILMSTQSSAAFPSQTSSLSRRTTHLSETRWIPPPYGQP